MELPIELNQDVICQLSQFFNNIVMYILYLEALPQFSVTFQYKIRLPLQSDCDISVVDSKAVPVQLYICKIPALSYTIQLISFCEL